MTNLFKRIIPSLTLFLFACAHVQAQGGYTPCLGDPDRQAQRSAELQKIVDQDQEDRKGAIDSIDWQKVLPRDLQRRTRVAEIFAEGCFKSAQDFSAAALVFQHGDTAEHVYQTFIWAKRAVDLGDPTQKWLMAAGIDRYLVRTGHKQLFATQGAKDVQTQSSCWCLEPVEEVFPESQRVDYAKKTLKQSFDWIQSLNENKSSCRVAHYCSHSLKPSPVGTVLGFW